MAESHDFMFKTSSSEKLIDLRVVCFGKTDRLVRIDCRDLHGMERVCLRVPRKKLLLHYALLHLARNSFVDISWLNTVQ